MQKEVLEVSTNTHVLEAEKITKIATDGNTIKLKISGKGVLTHGEHGTIVTESPDVIKYVQQELNPVTKKIQAAFD